MAYCNASLSSTAVSMQGQMLAPQTPEHKAFSISSALADWHDMVCDIQREPVGRSGAGGRRDIAFYDSKISPRLGKGTLDLVAFDDDFLLLAMRGRFHETLNYQVVGEGWTRLHFRRSARTLMEFEGVGPSELEGPLCQILHQPVGMLDEEWIEGGANLDWVTVFMRPEMLTERFKLDSIRLADPVRRLASGADEFLLENWSLSAAMMLVMDQLLGNSYSGDLKRVHLEAKATELVCLMSQVLNHRTHDDSPVKLRPRDIEALHEVRKVLAQSLTGMPSIEALARGAGINRNKLTYGFKHLFGQTISEFCLKARLQAGWKLLQESSLPIAVIAQKVGYSHAGAFATAFRQHFGITPTRVRHG